MPKTNRENLLSRRAVQRYLLARARQQNLEKTRISGVVLERAETVLREHLEAVLAHQVHGKTVI